MSQKVKNKVAVQKISDIIANEFSATEDANHDTVLFFHRPNTPKGKDSDTNQFSAVMGCSCNISRALFSLGQQDEDFCNEIIQAGAALLRWRRVQRNKAENEAKKN